MEWLKKYDNYYFVLGRTLLGLYFIVPGMSKVAGYEGYLDLMASKGVPLVEILLPLTILIQVGAGLFLIAGKNLRVSALLLFGLTILIKLIIQNYWALAGDTGHAQATQNFVKNLAIAAGLLVLATKDKS